MKKVLSENKKVMLFTGIGVVLMLIAVIFTGVIGISKHVQYFNATIKDYGAIWAPTSTMGNTKFLLMAFIYFDLAVLCQKFSFDDLLELYSDLKAVYANFPNAISLPQKFICETIYNRLEYSDPSLKEKNDRLKVICQSYLKEEPLFV